MARNTVQGDLSHFFFCPGCDAYHGLDDRWTVTKGPNGVTVRASVLVNPGNLDGAPRCHSFITDGRIEFLEDSTHNLAGQTVALEEFEEVKRG